MDRPELGPPNHKSGFVFGGNMFFIRGPWEGERLYIIRGRDYEVSGWYKNKHFLGCHTQDLSIRKPRTTPQAFILHPSYSRMDKKNRSKNACRGAGVHVQGQLAVRKQILQGTYSCLQLRLRDLTISGQGLRGMGLRLRKKPVGTG